MIMVDMMIPTFDPFPRRWTAGRNRLACKGDLRSSEIFIIIQIPSEMEVAPHYTLFNTV